jgi:hypothetical protein
MRLLHAQSVLVLLIHESLGIMLVGLQPPVMSGIMPLVILKENPTAIVVAPVVCRAYIANPFLLLTAQPLYYRGLSEPAEPVRLIFHNA